MRIGQKLDDHGRLTMEIMIDSEKQKKFRETNYKGKQINIIDSRENEENRLFSGRIKEVNRRSKDGVMFAQVKAVSYTADLDTGRSRRSFQDIDMTYEQVVNEVTQNSEAEFIWSVEDRKIAKPLSSMRKQIGDL